MLEARFECLRLYRPGPTVAFGRLDTVRPGFGRAVDAAAAHGFAPVLRAPGGHAAAYGPDALLLELIALSPDAVADVQRRFAGEGERLAGVLRGLGVDARVGSLPGEYCPGRWSVVAGSEKLIGTAQRVVSGAYLFGAEIACGDPAALRAVLIDVYAALELGLDPSTVGAVPAPIDAVESAVVEAYGSPSPAAVPEDVLARAESLAAPQSGDSPLPRSG